MYRFIEALLWTTVAVPFLGFAYCFYLETMSEAGLTKSRLREGLLAGLAVSVVHLVQTIGILNISVASPWAHANSVMFAVTPLALGTAVFAIRRVRRYGDHEIRSVGTASAVIAGAGTVLAVLPLLATA
jgi:hypothetical protein